MNNGFEHDELKIKDIPYPLKEQHLKEEQLKKEQLKYQTLTPQEKRAQKKIDAKIKELVDVFEGKPKHKFRLLGFRSNVLIKKIISCMFLVYPILTFIAFLFMPVDNMWEKAEIFITFLILGAPYIFLSETRYRKYIPFFKKRTFFSSALGLFIVYAILFNLLSFLQNMKI